MLKSGVNIASTSDLVAPLAAKYIPKENGNKLEQSAISRPMTIALILGTVTMKYTTIKRKTPIKRNQLNMLNILPPVFS
jgi:hypothetical protein